MSFHHPISPRPVVRTTVRRERIVLADRRTVAVAAAFWVVLLGMLAAVLLGGAPW